jgi:hypothetical protein
MLQLNMGFVSKHSNCPNTKVLLWSQVRKATKKGKKFVV